MLINLANVVTSPYFAQDFQIKRQTGSFDGTGKYDPASSEIVVAARGTIQAATDSALKEYPEADRAERHIVVHTTSTVGIEGRGVLAKDVIVWQGRDYRVVGVLHAEDWGFVRALAQLIQ